VSKAFTRESDDAGDNFAPVRAPLPPGTQNYITSEGAKRIRSELDRLLQTKRAASATGNQTGIEQRIQYLQNLIGTFVVVESGAGEVVRFGSIVKLWQNGEEETYRIVGVDEIDLDRNQISWLSPLARALMSRRVGEEIEFRAPSGVQKLKVLGIA
jgi:transcription elongation factor GreB